MTIEDAQSPLAQEFERHRPYLRSVAYRMLGSVTEAEDAVQEAWLRLDRRPPAHLAELRPWLTTVISRICLDLLRSRRARREDYAGTWLPEPIIGTVNEPTPEEDAVAADSVGLALLVVLELLSPSERLAFVLHDVFALSFDEIADVVGRTPSAARQLASRARRRVQASAPDPHADLAVQQRVVDAFLAAARDGDFERLLMLLDPDVVLRIDGGGRGPMAIPPAVGREAVLGVIAGVGRPFAGIGRSAVVNGGPGVIVGRPGHVIAVAGMSVAHGRIRSIDIVGDPAKLRRVNEA